MAIYYVDMAVGDDANLGTSEGAGNAWKTIDKAMNTVGTGDKVWVKASADYTETATIDTIGGTSTPIIFEGYTSTPGDGGRAIITGGGVRANCIVDNLTVDTAIYYLFKNLRFTNATSTGFFTDCTNITFKNCKFDTHGGDGFTGKLIACEGCDFEGNGSSGANITSGGGVFIRCTFYSNTNFGVNSNGSTTLAYCIFFSNAGKGIYLSGASAIHVIINCTVDGDGKDTNEGVEYTTNTAVVAIVNSVFYDCVFGMSCGAGDMGERVISRNNCLNSNTADYNNAATFVGEITSVPNFVNEVAGADYTPNTDSPLIDAGFDAGS